MNPYTAWTLWWGTCFLGAAKTCTDWAEWLDGRMTKAEFGTARDRFLSRAPVEMSTETRRLAGLALAKRDRDMQNPEPAEQWAERLMKAMYGE